MISHELRAVEDALSGASTRRRLRPRSASMRSRSKSVHASRITTRKIRCLFGQCTLKGAKAHTNATVGSSHSRRCLAFASNSIANAISVRGIGKTCALKILQRTPERGQDRCQNPQRRKQQWLPTEETLPVKGRLRSGFIFREGRSGMGRGGAGRKTCRELS